LQKERENNNNHTTHESNTSITETTASANKSPYRILYVDDDNDILITFKKILEDNCFLVDAFSNPLEALSSFKPGRYDLLLIDIKMPQMNGFELNQEIRKKSKDTKIKTCFITAYDVYYEPLKKEFPGLDVGCFIQKPVEAKDLVNRINKELQ
jgi:DNA-binding response OmpR family regulator